MEPLLEITTTPIELEYEISRAKLECVSQAGPSYTMTREVGGLDISYKPGRVRMDSYEMRSSLGFKNNYDLLVQYAQKGRQTALNMMDRVAQEGDMMRDASMNSSSGSRKVMAQIALSRMSKDVNYQLGFLPSTGTKFDWEPQQLTMKYKADKLNFNWNTQTKVKYKYTPASIEFKVRQYPSVDVKYIGKPIYIPKSAAPDYA